MRKLFLTLCLFSFTQYGFANALYQSNGDTVSERPVRIMIIPLNPTYYLSDADQQLSEYNHVSSKQIRDWFRSGLEANVNAGIITNDEYQTQRFIDADNEDLQNDLHQIYYGYGLAYEKALLPNIVEGEVEHKSVSDIITDLFKQDDSNRSASDKHNLGEVYPSDQGDQYLNIKLHNPRMLSDLAEKYQVDMFVFINQFEVKTNYETCLDRATNNFERQFTVHFSIFNKKGKQIYGNSATLYTDSNSRDMTEIISHYLPKLCGYISDQVPARIKVKPDQQAEQDSSIWQE